MANEKEPLLPTILENNSQPHEVVVTKSSLEKPVFIITSDVEDEPERKLIIIREETRKRICGSGRFVTFAIIWVVLIISIVVLGVYFRLDDGENSGSDGKDLIVIEPATKTPL